MKKHFLILISILVVSLTLCSCGQNAAGPEEESINYDDYQEAMGNYSTNSRFCIADGWIYGHGFNDNGDPIFIKMRTDGTDRSIMDSTNCIDMVTVNGEYAYGVSDMDFSLYRYRLGGDDKKRLLSDVYYYQIVGDKIYYTTVKSSDDGVHTEKYYKCDLNGKNKELVLDKEVYYPFIIKNLLIYQDDNDNETIHFYDLESESDERVTDTYSYAPILNNGYLYYIETKTSTNDGCRAGDVVRLNLEKKEKKVLYKGAGTGALLVHGDQLFFTNGNDKNRLYSISKDGEHISLVTQDENSDASAIFGDELIYYDYDSNFEYIDHIYISKLDGSNKVDISE